MTNSNGALVNVFFAYQLSYVPRGYRKVRTRWCSGMATIAVRSVSMAALKPAFRVERQRASGRSVTEIFRFDEALWWPIVFHPPFWNKQFFFNALENGIPAALEALSIDVLWAGKAIDEFDPFFVGRIVGSTEEEMRTMVERAAENLLLIDDENLLIRGGEPIYVAPRDTKIPHHTLFADVANSGLAFGSALPLDPLLRLDEGTPAAPAINAAAIEGRIFRFSSGFAHDPTCNVHKFENRSTTFDPIDFQIRACLRQLSTRIEQTLDRSKLPQETLHSAKAFTHFRRYIGYTTIECATYLRDFMRWYRDLPLKHGYRFRAEYDLILRCIASVTQRCRCGGLSSPFESQLDPADEEALSLLSQ